MPDRPRLSAARRFEARAAGLPLPRAMALSALAGALAALAQAPFNLWPLGLVAFAALFALFHASAARGGRRAWWAGWAAGAGYFAAGQFWIVEPFFVDAARHGWMAPFALIFLAGGLALFWGGAFALAHRLGARPLTWVAALTGAELLRSYVFTGYPWSLIGYTLAASPLAQLGAFIGPHGLTALTLAIAVSLWQLLTPARLKTLPAVALYAAAFAACLHIAQPPATPAGAPVLRLVQPNAPQHQKWDPDYVPVFFRRQLEYTVAAPAGPPPALIVWPETAIPWLLDDASEALRIIAGEARDTPVLLGLRRLDGSRLFNSAVLLTPDGTPAALYDKYHLVPFGEYVPFGDIAARFGIHGLAAGEGDGFSSGPGPHLMALPGIGPALPLICYEAVFPQDVNAAAARPRLLLQITNDAWFGRLAGPYQHLQQARMRAIEQGLPMARVANTGVSAMIDAKGHVTAALPLGQAGFIDAALPPALPPTPYTRTGDWPALALVLAALALAGLRRRAAAPFPIDGAGPSA